MLPQLDPDLVATLADIRGREGSVLVLTGAGISAESGIPTFRGPEGYWTVGSKHYYPEDLATQAAFARDPRLVWHWYLYRLGSCHGAQPNPGHLALVELDRAIGARFSLVTQNVDGLHLRAGNTRERTFEIHGNIDYMRCATSCTAELHRMPSGIEVRDCDGTLSDAIFEQLRCPRCQGLARPHVLWFDEYYDDIYFYWSQSVALANECDVCIAIGTSGATNLPSRIGEIVVNRGVPLIDVNPIDGPFGEFAERSGGHVVRGPAGQWLPAIVAGLV